MHTKTKDNMVVMGVYDTVDDVRRALAKLSAIGVAKDCVSVIAHPAYAQGEYPGEYRDKTTRMPAGGAVASTATLAATLIGIGLFAVPLGGLLVAGPIAVAGGAAAAWGSPYFGPDSISELGVPRRDAKLAVEAVRRGGIVIVAHVPQRDVRSAADALDRAGAIDLYGRAAQWEAEGWSYEPNAPMWTRDAIEHERVLRHPPRDIRTSSPSLM